VSRKLSRLVLVASVLTGFGLAPMLDAHAARSGIDVTGTGFGDGSLDIYVNDVVTWYIKDGEHTVTPDKGRGGQKWPDEPSGTLKAGEEFTAKPFPVQGRYYYLCEVHSGMTGFIDVTDPNATTTTTTTTGAPTTTTTARPVVVTPTTAAPAPAASAGTKPPVTAAPAPTTTATAKPEKDKKPKDGTTTSSTETTVPPPAPVDLPDSAIIPALPGAGTVVQEGAVAETPASLEGEAAANHRSKPRRKGMKLLIATGLGISALGIGAAGYKFANRSSKYFPA
jgi:plastocyanin